MKAAEQANNKVNPNSNKQLLVSQSNVSNSWIKKDQYI
jgi:hypothetical protein